MGVPNSKDPIKFVSNTKRRPERLAKRCFKPKEMVPVNSGVVIGIFGCVYHKIKKNSSNLPLGFSVVRMGIPETIGWMLPTNRYESPRTGKKVGRPSTIIDAETRSTFHST